MQLKIVETQQQQDYAPIPEIYTKQIINQAKIQLDTYPTGTILAQTFNDQYYTATHYLLDISKKKVKAKIVLNEGIVALQYIWKGRCSILTPDLQRIQIEDGEYSLLFLKNGEHTITLNEGRHELFTILLSAETLEALPDVHPAIHSKYFINQSYLNYLSTTTSSIRTLYNKVKSNTWHTTGWPILCRTLLLSMITESIINIGQGITAPIHENSSDQKFRDAKVYVDNNLEKKLDLHTISEKLNTIPDTLRKGFKRTFGYNLLSYIREKRIKRASELLIETELPIQEIAWDVGYESPAGFSRIFSIFYGTSPMEYRMRTKKNSRFGK